MDANNIFKGGRPYVLDAARISEAYPVSKLVEGLVIEHSELEKILDEKRGTRYYGVINSWITQQKNQNGIIIVSERKIGIKVLNPAQVLHHGETRIRQKSVQLGKATKILGWVDRARLDATGQARLDHECRVVAALKGAVDLAKKQMAIELSPIQSLPRRKLPSADPATAPN